MNKLMFIYNTTVWKIDWVSEVCVWIKCVWWEFNPLKKKKGVSHRNNFFRKHSTVNRASLRRCRAQFGNNFIWPRFPVNLHQGLYLYVLYKPRVCYTLAQGPLRRGAQLGAIGPIGLRPALIVLCGHGVIVFISVCLFVSDWELHVTVSPGAIVVISVCLFVSGWEWHVTVSHGVIVVISVCLFQTESRMWLWVMGLLFWYLFVCFRLRVACDCVSWGYCFDICLFVSDWEWHVTVSHRVIVLISVCLFQTESGMWLWVMGLLFIYLFVCFRLRVACDCESWGYCCYICYVVCFRLRVACDWVVGLLFLYLFVCFRLRVACDCESWGYCFYIFVCFRLRVACDWESWGYCCYICYVVCFRLRVACDCESWGYCFYICLFVSDWEWHVTVSHGAIVFISVCLFQVESRMWLRVMGLLLLHLLCCLFQTESGMWLWVMGLLLLYLFVCFRLRVACDCESWGYCFYICLFVSGWESHVTESHGAIVVTSAMLFVSDWEWHVTVSHGVIVVISVCLFQTESCMWLWVMGLLLLHLLCCLFQTESCMWLWVMGLLFLYLFVCFRLRVACDCESWGYCFYICLSVSDWEWHVTVSHGVIVFISVCLFQTESGMWLWVMGLLFIYLFVCFRLRVACDCESWGYCLYICLSVSDWESHVTVSHGAIVYISVCLFQTESRMWLQFLLLAPSDPAHLSDRPAWKCHRHPQDTCTFSLFTVIVRNCSLFIYLTSFVMVGARSSSMVRAFAHGAMGCRIDPSWWTYWAISCSSRCSTNGF